MNMHALKGRAQITSAFRRGRKFACESIVVHCRSNQQAEEDDAPKGGDKDLFVICAVRKKQVPLAVTRNRIKRIVRESVRAFMQENPNLPFMTLAFVWQLPMKHHSEAKTENINPQVHAILHQAMQYFSAKQSKESSQ